MRCHPGKIFDRKIREVFREKFWKNARKMREQITNSPFYLRLKRESPQNLKKISEFF